MGIQLQPKRKYHSIGDYSDSWNRGLAHQGLPLPIKRKEKIRFNPSVPRNLHFTFSLCNLCFYFLLAHSHAFFPTSTTYLLDLIFVLHMTQRNEQEQQGLGPNYHNLVVTGILYLWSEQKNEVDFSRSFGHQSFYQYLYPTFAGKEGIFFQLGRERKAFVIVTLI